MPSGKQLAPIISIINLKGGTGKTTTAIYMATTIHEMGRQVAVIDADNEQSALNWAQGGLLPFEVLPMDKDQLGKQARAQAEQGRMVFIDCAPNNRDTLYAAALVADKIIIPVAPTGHDVNRLEATLALLVEVEQSRDKDLANILVTRWDKRRVLAREFIDIFKDYPVLENKISDRVVYQKEFGILPTFTREYQDVLEEVLNNVT